MPMDYSHRFSSGKEGLIEEFVNSINCFVARLTDHVNLVGKAFVNLDTCCDSLGKLRMPGGLGGFSRSDTLELLAPCPIAQRADDNGVSPIRYGFNRALPAQRFDSYFIALFNERSFRDQTARRDQTALFLNAELFALSDRGRGHRRRKHRLSQLDARRSAEFSLASFRFLFQPGCSSPVSDLFDDLLAFRGKLRDYARQLRLKGHLSLGLFLGEVKVKAGILFSGCLALFLESGATGFLLVQQRLESLEILGCAGKIGVEQGPCLVDDVDRQAHAPSYLQSGRCACYAGYKPVGRAQRRFVEFYRGVEDLFVLRCPYLQPVIVGAGQRRCSRAFEVVDDRDGKVGAFVRVGSCADFVQKYESRRLH